MSYLLPIATLENPVIRKISEPISNIKNKNLQQLIDQLITTCQVSNGVGIAAPQVSQSLRLFIVASRPNARYPDAPLMSPTAMINPKIIEHGSEMIKGWEGCLSVPQQRGLVPRYTQITVEYLDRNGNLCQQVLSDFIARIFQHELDHLDGLVFLDRLESLEDLYSEEDYQKLSNK